MTGMVRVSLISVTVVLNLLPHLLRILRRVIDKNPLAQLAPALVVGSERIDLPYVIIGQTDIRSDLVNRATEEEGTETGEEGDMVAIENEKEKKMVLRRYLLHLQVLVLGSLCLRRCEINSQPREKRGGEIKFIFFWKEDVVSVIFFFPFCKCLLVFIC